MVGVVQQISLLFLVTLSLGGIPSTILAQDCSGADKVAEEGGKEVIININTEEDGGSVILYVLPSGEFEGINLLAPLESDDTQHTAWFPAEPLCFPKDGKWQQLQVWAEIRSDSDGRNIIMGFESPTCLRECLVTNAPQSLQNLTVVAYGMSRWIIKTQPTQCNITYLGVPDKSPSLPICQSLPVPLTDKILWIFGILGLCIISFLLIAGALYYKFYVIKKD